MLRQKLIFSLCGGLFLFGALISVPVYAAEPNPSLKHLEKWVGQYPQGTGKAGESLWEDPVFHKGVEDIMGKESTQQMIKGWGDKSGSPSASKILRGADVLYLYVSKNHDGISQNVHFYIDMKVNVIKACWHSADVLKKKMNDYWLETGKVPLRMANDGCRVYDARNPFPKEPVHYIKVNNAKK